ncbi:helix-turn-helix domain-containing protein [Cellulosilyticum sp. WCF-2]|uniref:helix-turn-helix domain-containing protein n=1 Tax=Cellulosilyticum sp. WCF-2 TaxID=2497860 RepID=UPI000F8EECBB|nr:helix-turn-helix domain-containing protein [Cellulosilyticum sp. WCF-2]
MVKKKVYTVREVAEILNVCEMTIYRKVKNNEIPSKRIGRSIRISSEYMDNLCKDPINEVQRFIFR